MLRQYYLLNEVCCCPWISMTCEADCEGKLVCAKNIMLSLPIDSVNFYLQTERFRCWKLLFSFILLKLLSVCLEKSTVARSEYSETEYVEHYFWSPTRLEILCNHWWRHRFYWENPFQGSIVTIKRQKEQNSVDILSLNLNISHCECSRKKLQKY